MDLFAERFRTTPINAKMNIAASTRAAAKNPTFRFIDVIFQLLLFTIYKAKREIQL
jgi:hypothetical protein